jgi:uncharacterized repeat protein (TIGR04052 family)
MTASRLAVSLLCLPLLACGGEREVTLQLSGLVGDEPVECGGTYSGVGTSSTDLTVSDLRLYVHDVRVLTADGEEHEVALEQDGVWQLDDVVLLDFEDGGAGCPHGTTATNTTIRGTIPDGAEITGVRFVLGVPEARNHDDVTTAPSPLDQQTMYWNWNGGYIFFRLDGSSTGMSDGFVVHIGSTGCEGDGRGNVTSCVQENRVEVELTDYDPDTDTIAVDVGALFSESDLDTDQGGASGCRSGFDDMDCEPIFHGFGLPFAGTPPSGEQRLFRVVR